LRLFSQSGFSITAVDKPQVFATALNRRKFAKNTVDLNRRKFSIDPGFATIAAREPFRNHTEPVPETWRSPSALNETVAAGETGVYSRCFSGRRPALSVRLSSL
jgi:hypothetical protein